MVARSLRCAAAPADELCDVAHDLAVDPETHLYLGAMATEARIKHLSEHGSLAHYQIVHFATHGAVAGQVSRASEPGLLLTVKLITRAVATLKSDPTIGRAEALRRSMLAMMTSGKDYEAHPTFWAPFVLVGEGGATQ